MNAPLILRCLTWLMPEALSYEQAAELAGVSARTVYRWAADGQVRRADTGGRHATNGKPERGVVTTTLLAYLERREI